MIKRLKKIIKTRFGNLILSAINDNEQQIVESMRVKIICGDLTLA